MAGEVERLQELVDKYDNIVFFGGAGVSTESGIPDFRSQDGLYHQKYDYPPETIFKPYILYEKAGKNFSNSTETRCFVTLQNQMQHI